MSLAYAYIYIWKVITSIRLERKGKGIQYSILNRLTVKTLTHAHKHTHMTTHTHRHTHQPTWYPLANVTHTHTHNHHTGTHTHSVLSPSVLTLVHLSKGAVRVGQISLANSQEVHNRALLVLVSQVERCATKTVLSHQICLVGHQPLDTLQVTAASGNARN